MPAPEARAAAAWGPLAGRTILVTRAREQAGDLSARLEAAGATVLEHPAIRIVDPETWDDLDAALDRLDRYDWVVFTSANGVRHVARRLSAKGGTAVALGRARLAAIGPATARALEALGLTAALVPREYRAEGVAAAFEDVDLRGARVLIPRAAVARDVLPAELRRRGATVDVVTAYRAVPAGEDANDVRAALRAGAVDVVTFASSGTVRSFLAALGPDGPALVGRAAVAAIGPVTAETARACGLRVAVEAREYTIEGLVRSLVDALGKRGASDRRHGRTG